MTLHPSSIAKFFLPASNTPTNSTKTCSYRSNSCIFWRIFVTVIAMGSSCISGSHIFTTKDVHSRGDFFKVAWPHTFGDATQMIKSMPWQQWAIFFLPSPTMRRNIFVTTRKFELSIKSTITTFTPGSPNPTPPKERSIFGDRPIFINLLPKTYTRISISHRVDCIPYGATMSRGD